MKTVGSNHLWEKLRLLLLFQMLLVHYGGKAGQSAQPVKTAVCGKGILTVADQKRRAGPDPGPKP